MVNMVNNCPRSLLEQFQSKERTFFLDEKGNGLNCAGSKLDGINLGGLTHEIDDERLQALGSGDEWAEELQENGVNYIYDIDKDEDNYVHFANLSKINLEGANLQDANFYLADLTDANLQDANLQGANLMRADLRDADLRDADLTGAKLEGAKLERGILFIELSEHKQTFTF